MPFSRQEYDAIVIGSGPNGLSAAITMAEARRSVLVIEGYEMIGGGARSAELKVPGFVHDGWSSGYPMGGWSPFFRAPPPSHFEPGWVHPSAPPPHPLDDGSAGTVDRPRERRATN